MGIRKNNISPLAGILSMFLLFFITMTSMAQGAVMPDYQVLSAIDNNVAAPTDVALDRLENVYVAESSQNRVQKFTSDGTYVSSLTGLAKPICVFVDSSDKIYVCNKDTGSVAVYDAAMSLLYKLGWQDGVVDGEFIQPNDVVVNAAGTAYVVDKTANVVKMYNADGTYAGDFSPVDGGGAAVAFTSPTSITIQPGTGNIVILDHPVLPGKSGNVIYVFGSNGVLISAFDKSGTLVGDLHLSQHLTVDSEERIYVTDSFQNVTLVYDIINGAYLGDVFDINDRVRTPLGITIGSSNRLYVTSLNSGKVKVFSILSGSSVSPGDCNGDGTVDAGDISALVLEIFDGDGSLPADAPGGTFAGDPVGSDANSDGVVDAGDISCAVLLIFNGPGACQ